ncbi:(2Fe-2S)-binding protein [Acetobacterium tundrae]|uniref:2Fe-2S iron-sulfur cluster binding domain-containing protein n=1 Tax=Acetobacterium tundrae TaxID=132932 RepID=A0ABR6WP14_9FIRM|nr:(2Fe-2S)-binding protein [Acetobacterium tundrae]MBC3798242.1 2Fe-2S iron-sulfur cluster binding domain-containing protein [Acetobacterium tundrae]
METKFIALTVNGKKYEFLSGSDSIVGIVPWNETLSDTLRQRLDLTGSKEACGEGACGCCTVLVDNRAVSSCMTLTSDCNGKEIITIEGLEDPVTGELDPLQQAFIDYYAFQCGFCTPGIIMAAKGLLIKNPHPTEEEVKDALSGNQCRCISQYHVIDAVMHVSKQISI